MKKNILILFLFLALGVAGFFVVTFKLRNDDLKQQEKTLLQKVTTLSLNKDRLEKDLDQSMEDFTEAQKKLREGESRYDLLNNSCDEFECLMVHRSVNTTLPLGLVQISGYSTQVEQTSLGETTKCDSFVITEGSLTLQAILKDRLLEQAGINTSSVQGLPVLTLSLTDLSLVERLKVSKSSDVHPITLSVFFPMQKNVTQPCQSEAKILEVI